MENANMKLIDTYISEVGRRLPKKARTDIEAEIRSTLEDMLEERSRKTGKPVDAELAIEILKEFGAPEKVAASYQGERYLIGPQLFPTFEMVLKIVLSVFGTLALIGLGIQLARSGLTLENILEGIAGVGSAFIAALGNVVLIFAIIEWVMRNESLHPKAKEPVKEKVWDPRSLEKISPPNQVKMGEGIVDIVFDFAAIVIFNFYPQIIGFTNSLNSVIESGNWSSVTTFPIFTDLFFDRFIPWLTLVWGLDILINIIVLRMGSWKMVTRLGNIAVRAGTIIIGAFILATPGLLNITAESIFAAGSLGASTAELLATLARQGFSSILVIVMIVEGIEIVKHLYRLVVGNK
jgi:hypothetical protein